MIIVDHDGKQYSVILETEEVFPQVTDQLAFLLVRKARQLARAPTSPRVNVTDVRRGDSKKNTKNTSHSRFS